MRRFCFSSTATAAFKCFCLMSIFFHIHTYTQAPAYTHMHTISKGNMGGLPIKRGWDQQLRVYRNVLPKHNSRRHGRPARHKHTCSVLRHADKSRFLVVTRCVRSAHVTKTSVWKNIPGNGEQNRPGAKRYLQIFIQTVWFLYEYQTDQMPHAESIRTDGVSKCL